MCGIEKKRASSPRTRAGWSPPSSKRSSPLRRVRLHRRARGEARPGLRRRARLEGAAARLLARLLRRARRDQGSAHHAGARQPERAARPAHLPGQGRRRRSRALCPTCGKGRLSLKLGKFGAFIGCSNYPECRFTRVAVADRPGRRGRRGRAAGRPRARRRSGDRRRGHVAQRPLRPLRAAGRRREAEALARCPRADARRR